MQRKLTVIVAADVVGYSTLMERDETGTLERLKSNRKQIFDPAVAAHGGRIFKLMGDGALAEFGSVVSAVDCAYRIQQATEAAADRPIRYRIGITLGDVMVDGDDIYGDGVNVAARLQTLAPPGGIAASRLVRDQVVGKLALDFEDIGEQTIKNIERPVHVYVLHVPHTRVVDVPAAKMPRVAICVLPFANMSGDPEQEYFSDGITEDIITDLSKVSALWVAARNTAFMFKGKPLDAPRIAQQLNVTHLLEGSVRKAGNRVRISAQLIDGATGGHVWAERYDRDLDDIFALQDEIAQAIVAALKLRLLSDEKKAIERRGTSSAQAYELYLMARQLGVTGNVGAARRNEMIIRLCRRATEIDPKYARAWALMATAQMSLRLHLRQPGNDGSAAAERAIALDANLPEAYAARARARMNKNEFEAALRDIDIALALDADSYDANNAAGRWYYTQRRFREAIPHYEKAADVMETDYLAAGALISCYATIGDLEGKRRSARRALARVEKIVAVEPDNGSAMSDGVSALAALGETERAREWAERALLLDPDNANLRYNFACTLVTELGELDAALDLLEQVFARLGAEALLWTGTDPDLDPLRDHPRYKAMVAKAEGRPAQ